MKSRIIGSDHRSHNKWLKSIICLTILLFINSCTHSRLYETKHFQLLLPKNIGLKENVSIEDEGFGAYELIGQEAPPHSVILLLPHVIDTKRFLKERYLNNPIINNCPIKQFEIGMNIGYMRVYRTGVLTLESYCFNKDGWTILIEVSNSSSKFKNIDELIYSFEILTPI